MEKIIYMYHPEYDSFWIHEGELKDEDYNSIDIGLSNEVTKKQFLKGIKLNGQEKDFPEITKLESGNIIMGLADKAQEILQGFDPKKDSPNNSNQNLPDGEYDMVLNSVTHKVSERTGTEWVSLECEVIAGELSGRKEFVGMFFGTGSEFVTNKAIKSIAQAASVFEIELTNEDWEDEHTLVEGLQPAIGSQFLLKVVSTPNKKEPTNPYRNFDFIGYEDDGEDSEVDGESP